jgi:hypothetical protein
MRVLAGVDPLSLTPIATTNGTLRTSSAQVREIPSSSAYSNDDVLQKLRLVAATHPGY